MSAFDSVEGLGRSTVQHGPANARVYLMRMDSRDLPELPGALISFADERNYTKVFAKIPASAKALFLKSGYEIEAEISGYFRGREDALFACIYLDPGRREGDRSEVVRICELALSQSPPANAKPAATDFPIGIMTEEDLTDMAQLYRTVFESYPFPIHEPSYLRRTMQSHVAYYGIREQGQLIALASAEKDIDAKSAELTDFATLPTARRRGLARILLVRMENDLAINGYRTGYTIARALSPGMNIVFARAGYRYGGLLWNNTQICGRLEPMNVWYKSLDS